MFRDSLTIVRSRQLLSRLRRRLGWSADRLRDHQWQALQRLVRHAYEQTQLYRRLYDAAGAHPEDIRTWDDFARLPTVDKATLRAAFPDAAVARSFAGQPLVRRSTGGSTGEPLQFVLDRETIACKIAGNLRSMEIAGLRLGWDRLVQTSPDARFVSGWARWWGDRLLGRRCLDPFRPDWDAACRELRRLRPTVLCGWTSYLRTVADRLLAGGQRLPVRLVLTTSETLTAEDRQRLTCAFEAPVFDQYGSTEFGRVATEYPGGQGLLIQADLTYVETIAGPGASGGEPGELVLTSLVNRAMPFLRYRIGDLGRLGAETTGRFPAYPVLERLDGRVQDVLWRSDGTPIVPEFVHRVLREYGEIRRYQVEQRTHGPVEIRTLLDRPLSPARAAALREAFRGYLGDVAVTLRETPELAIVSGKQRLVIGCPPPGAADRV